MAVFYKPHRNPHWNYGGKNWKLSRSKLDLFIECPRCFYIDNTLGTARPRGFPFNLNSAVDELLKKEFDIHRESQTPHPLMTRFGIDAIPFQHENMDVWRDVFKGVQTRHASTGLTISGAVDDIWITPKEELIVVDYKATSKDEEVTLDAEWQDGYKRQMEVYQWLFRQNKFDVSPVGYFVYANGRRDKNTFEGVLEFRMKVIPYTGDDGWVDDAIVRAHNTLEKKELPPQGDECEYCMYRDAVDVVTGKMLDENSESVEKLF